MTFLFYDYKNRSWQFHYAEMAVWCGFYEASFTPIVKHALITINLKGWLTNLIWIKLHFIIKYSTSGSERIILKPRTAIGDFYTTWGGRWQQQRSFVKIKRGRNWKERKRKKKYIWLWSCTTSMIWTIFWLIIFVTIYKIFSIMCNLCINAFLAVT